MRFSQEFRDNFPYALGERFEKYIQTIHKWEMNPLDLYWSGGWKADEVEALQFIQGRYAKDVIHRGDDFTISFVSLNNKREFLDDNLRASFRTARNYRGFPFPDRRFKDTDIRDPVLRKQILSWSVTLYRLRYLKKLAVEYMSDVLDRDEGLNTPGQLYRVWPEAASVMDKRYSGRVMGQKLQSSLPKPFLARTTVDQFRKQPHLEEINTHFLAMSVLDCEEQDYYPNYW
jgi:hypothetical protein